MRCNKPAISETKGGGERDKKNSNVKEEVDEIGNERTREWIR